MEIKHEKMYTSDGTLYIPIKIEKPSDAMIVLHHTILRHTADMFRAMTTAIAERYNLDEDDILNTVVEHPNFKNFIEHPILTDLGDYFEDSKKDTTSPPKKIFLKKNIGKPTETKPTETKPTEVKPTEMKSTEVKPTEMKPTEVKSTEMKPTEIKPTEMKPTEIKPTEMKPIESTATETKPIIKKKLDLSKIRIKPRAST